MLVVQQEGLQPFTISILTGKRQMEGKLIISVIGLTSFSELRLYLKDRNVDVEPLGDRLLIFQSRSIEHEVMPSHGKRFAITMWYY